MKERQPVKVDIEVSGIEEATKKAERYVELLKEAKTLAEELASFRPELTLSEDPSYQNVVGKSDNTHQ